MPFKISEDETSETFLDETGQPFTVAKEFARPALTGFGGQSAPLDVIDVISGEAQQPQGGAVPGQPVLPPDAGSSTQGIPTSFTETRADAAKQLVQTGLLQEDEVQDFIEPPAEPLRPPETKVIGKREGFGGLAAQQAEIAAEVGKQRGEGQPAVGAARGARPGAESDVVAKAAVEGFAEDRLTTDQRIDAIAKKSEANQLGLVQAQNKIQEDFDLDEKQHRERIASADKEADTHQEDPNRWWSERSTGGKIAIVFAQAMGALGAGLARTPNFAAKLVDDMIRRDIDAQRQEGKTKERAAARATQSLAIAQRAYKDELSQNLEAMRLNLGAASKQLEAVRVKSGVAEDDARFQLMRADLLARSEAVDAQLFGRQQQLSAQQRLKAAESAVPTITRDTDLASLTQKQRELVVKGPDGKPMGVVLRPKDAEKIDEITDNFTTLDETFTDLAKLGKEQGGIKGTIAFFNEPKQTLRKQATADQLRVSAQMLKKKEFQLGVLSKSDLELLDKVIADPTAFLNSDAKLQSILKLQAKGRLAYKRFVENRTISVAEGSFDKFKTQAEIESEFGTAQEIKEPGFLEQGGSLLNPIKSAQKGFQFIKEVTGN